MNANGTVFSQISFEGLASSSIVLCVSEGLVATTGCIFDLLAAPDFDFDRSQFLATNNNGYIYDGQTFDLSDWRLSIEEVILRSISCNCGTRIISFDQGDIS